MSKYDGPSYKKNQKRLTKSEFPFYRDSAHATKKDNLFDRSKTSKYEKPIKITRETKDETAKTVFSGQKNENDNEKTGRLSNENKNENTVKKVFSHNKNSLNKPKELFEKDEAIYNKRRSSTPFKVQKIPSPYYGLKKNNNDETIKINYKKISERLEKEEDNLILSSDHLCERLSKISDEENSLTQINEIENQQSGPLEQTNKKLNRSLASMIEEEQVDQNRHQKKRTNYFSDENIIQDVKNTFNPKKQVITDPVQLNSSERLSELTESSEQIMKEVNKIELPDIEKKAELKKNELYDEEIEMLELKAALSRFNYIEKNAEKVQKKSRNKETDNKNIVANSDATQQIETVQLLEVNKMNESENKENIKKSNITIIEPEPESEPEPEPKPEPEPEPVTRELLESSSNQAHGNGNEQLRAYKFPSLDLLNPPVEFQSNAIDDWVLGQAELLNETLDAFNVLAQVAGWTVGPAVTQFELQLGRGVKVNKITNLADDLKLALAAKDIRIEAPIPGKNTVGVEIPNRISRPVMLSEVMASEKFKNSHSPLTVAIGVNLAGDAIVSTLDKMPHGLIAGATGSGKSVFINSILVSLLYKANPSEVKLILIDPKAVELAPYNGIPHLLSPVISEPKAASEALKWAVNEMEERYQKLALAGVRNIQRFNEKAQEHEDHGLKLPYIVIIIDELADLMMVASSDVQDSIVRITQKARAAGIHLLVATQRPSVDVITGTIKNNIPTRIAFMVSSQVDSRTIMDSGGAEKLLGRGDMLFLENGASQPMRIQGTYVEKEIDSIVKHVKEQRKTNYLFEPEGLLARVEAVEGKDELYEEILLFIIEEGQVSASSLQRKFKIGFNRASNVIETLEKENLISPNKGSKPRDVYLTKTDYDQQFNN